MNPQSGNPPIEESKANEDEKTQKVKRSRKDREVKINPTSIKSLEDLIHYFLEEKPTKPQKIEILEIPSSILAEKFQDFKEFPTELKNMALIFTKDSFKADSDINLILQNILEKKSDLEVFKLTIYDGGVDLKGINFSCIKELKKLKTLKINVGMNNLDLETQNALLASFNGHPDLTNLALCVNDCELKDDFGENLHLKWFEKDKIQGKLKKLSLNFAKNSFKFEMKFNLDLLKQLFLSFERLEILKINVAWMENANKALQEMGKIMEQSLIKMLTLRVLKLNFYYCDLQHENVETLCEGLAKLNEKLDIEIDLRKEPMEHEIQIRTIKAIEGMISLYRAVTNPRKFLVFY